MTDTAREFKVGDKVRPTGPLTESFNVGTVVRVGTYDVSVRFKSGEVAPYASGRVVLVTEGDAKQ